MDAQVTNKEIIGYFLDELNNGHNPNAWDSYCGEGFEHHYDIPEITNDLKGAKTLSIGILSAFPDITMDIDFLISENDFTVARITMNATHSGNYNGILPTHIPYTWPETHIFRLKLGKIMELFSEVRLEKLLWQISGKDDGFIAPPKSSISNFIAFMMGGLARLYKNTDNGPLSVIERNKQTVHRYVSDFKNGQKFTVFPKLFSHRFVHHFDFPDRTDKMDSFVSVGQTFLSAFPDCKVDLRQLLAEDTFVVERNKVSATHTGTFNGTRPTNKKVYWTEIHIYKLEKGKITENWPAVNFERILLQIH